MTLTHDQRNEIQIAKEQNFKTKRLTVPSLENILYDAFPVLDHGFVRVIDYLGSDESIVQAARVSYGRGTKKQTEDQALIHYLMRHRHSTPFEMCEIKFHLKMPIFVARQWIRHRTANINEYSARYSILDKEFYLPELDQIASQSAINNQGRGAPLPLLEAESIRNRLEEDANKAYDTYEFLLNEKGESDRNGLARELARMNLPINFYTQMYWKIDLHNLLHFLSLRADPHAQYEIRVFAETILNIVKQWVPITYDAFLNYRVGSVSLSEKAKDAIIKRLKGENINQEESGIGKREWAELLSIFPDLSLKTTPSNKE
ncbi:MAG: Flavin-dependent thymidylate synthase [Holosporales bacterium]